MNRIMSQTKFVCSDIRETPRVLEGKIEPDWPFNCLSCSKKEWGGEGGGELLSSMLRTQCLVGKNSIIQNYTFKIIHPGKGHNFTEKRLEGNMRDVKVFCFSASFMYFIIFYSEHVINSKNNSEKKRESLHMTFLLK